MDLQYLDAYFPIANLLDSKKKLLCKQHSFWCSDGFFLAPARPGHKTVRQHHPRFLYTPGWKCTPWHGGPATIIHHLRGDDRRTKKKHHPATRKVGTHESQSFVFLGFSSISPIHRFHEIFQIFQQKLRKELFFAKNLRSLAAKAQNLLFKDSLLASFELGRTNH